LIQGLTENKILFTGFYVFSASFDAYPSSGYKLSGRTPGSVRVHQDTTPISIWQFD
jgi:hypothetical protein